MKADPRRGSRTRIALLAILAGCSGGGGGGDGEGGGGGGGAVNHAPVADAGADQATSLLVGDVVLLDGSASVDEDSDALGYAWSLATPPFRISSATLSDPNVPDPSFVADVPGDYVARLTVSDGMADSAPDEVTVTVRVPPPVVSIAAPEDLAVVTSTPVTVTGTVDDPNATITVNGAAAANEKGSYTTGVPLVEGSNTVTVVARNGTGESSAIVEVILNTTGSPKVSVRWPKSGFVAGEEFAMGAPFHAAQIAVRGVVKVNTTALLPANNEPTVSVNGVPADVTLNPFTGDCTLLHPLQCWSFAATIPVERGVHAIAVVGTDVQGRTAAVHVSGTVDYCRIGVFDRDEPTSGKDPGVHALAGPHHDVQGNRCHEIDGCSGPLGLGLANDPTPLAVCNEASTRFGQGVQPPTEHFVHGLASAFDLPCNHHDVCYQTCVPVAGLSEADRDAAWSAAWQRCNDDQRARANAVCRRAYPNALCPSEMSLTCLAAGGCAKYVQERTTCFASAGVAFSAVSSAKGLERFRERQSDYCAD